MPNADARSVANEFIELARATSHTLTQMQVQKLAFFAQGFSLAFFDGRRLFVDDVEAWAWGPVVPSIYDGLKRYGARPIVDLIHKYEWKTLPSDRGPIIRDEFLNEESQVIRSVYQTYGHLNGGRLSELTHRPGTPWAKTYKDGVKGLVIDPALMRSFFSENYNRQPH